MKVLDLACAQKHVFEGWFASEEDFVRQHAQGLVSCPMCGDTAVEKKLSAPRLNLLGHARDPQHAAQSSSNTPSQPSQPSQEVAVAAHDDHAAMQAAWLGMARRIVANTEDVGERFAEEARRIHYGESEQRGIRGKASREETEALQDEGISVMQIALPEALKTPLQ